MSLDAVKTVLIQTHHPGNIGSASRAMKTMGLSRLCLVNPISFPDAVATQFSAGAADVLEAAEIESELERALKDCHLVVACTARPRGFDLPEISPQDAASLLLQHAELGSVAVLYGPERFGLSNDHLRLARYRVMIPTNPDYPSLNLASAVQVMSYELRKASLSQLPRTDTERVLPSTEDTERFYVHMEETLKQTGFIRKHHPGNTLSKLKQLFNRAEPDVKELQMLRGMLASFQSNDES